jgi:serine/threonine protein kinase
MNRRGAKERGCFSLVFRADDQISGKSAAIKFYDIAPDCLRNTYRRQSFDRESGILQSLLGARRCLQLVEAARTYDFALAVPGGAPVILPCPYFVVDWLDIEIEDYFLADPGAAHGSYSAEAKLRLFNEIILCVEALHRNEVCHRDLKADNLRAQDLENGKRLAIAIDLGTAAQIQSGCIQVTYGNPAGAPAYSSPEALAGLSGNHHLGVATDQFALGCLLFELFNRQYCARARLVANPGYDYTIYAMSLGIHAAASHADQLRSWDAQLPTYTSGITPVDVAATGSLVPPAIAPLVRQIVASLTHFDYRQRMSLEVARQRVWSAIRVLTREALYQRRLEEFRTRRQRRVQRARERDAKHPSPAPVGVR